MARHSSLTIAKYAQASAAEVPAAGEVLTAIECRDWRRLELLLDPDAHWTTALEEYLHGPGEVIVAGARLKSLNMTPSKRLLPSRPSRRQAANPIALG